MQEKMRVYNEQEVYQIMQSEAKRARVGTVLMFLRDHYQKNGAPPIVVQTLEEVLGDYGYDLSPPEKQEAGIEITRENYSEGRRGSDEGSTIRP